MLRQFIMILTIAFTITACSSGETQPQNVESSSQTEVSVDANTTDSTDANTEAQTTTPSENTDTTEEDASQTPASVEEEYEITDQTVILEALNAALTLPEIQGLSNSSLQENINSIIADAANEITASLDGTNPVTIGYETRYASPTLLSIIFKAEMTVESGTIIFWNPVNISITTASKISVDNLFNNDNIAVSKFNQAFNEAMAEIGYEYDKPEDWMIFTFDEKDIIFLVKESDLSEDYTEVSISNSLLKPALNSMFTLN